MARFFVGFAVATLVWAATTFGLYSTGWLAFGKDEPDELAEAGPDDGPDTDEGQPDKKRGRKRRSNRGERTRSGGGRSDDTGGTRANLPRGEATTGDDLDWDGERSVDMAGGEGQLSGKQIEAGFDGAMGRIRRCLVLVPAEGDVTGKLIFGMRVGSDGTPRAVNLSGPAVVTSGESGGCLRKAAQDIRFAKYSGPDTLFKYPVTLQ